jgi:hypothetical protein
MSLTGGKRKANKSLKAWVTFVKKVQKEEKLSYKDAIHRAKVRKDKGEKWMVGGTTPLIESATNQNEDDDMPTTTPEEEEEIPQEEEFVMEEEEEQQGGRRRRTRKHRASRKGRIGGKRRTARRHRGSRRR